MLLQTAIFHSFLCLSNISLYVCVCVCVCVRTYILKLIDGHLGIFCVLAIVSSAAIYMGVHVTGTCIF